MQLPAKALFYALLIILLIALISGSLIILSYTQRLQQERFFMQERLIRNCESGMTLLKTNSEKTLSHSVLDLYENGTDSILLEKKAWGFFTVATSKAFTNSFGLPQQFQKTAMLAHHVEDSTAVYLADKNKPLSLCGETVIRGTAYLPRAGVKQAYINGQNYIGDQLIYGDRKRSRRNLPELDLSLLDALGNPAEVEYSAFKRQLFQSFTKEILYLNKTSVYLNHHELQGHILVYADDIIQVAASSKLEDIILLAPKIIIEDGFQGCLQLIATDSLIIGKNCVFDYPSVLCLWNKESSSTSGMLQIGAGTKITGALVAKNEQDDEKIIVELAKSARVHGIVFTEGALQLEGEVYGTVYTEGFIFKTASSVYHNHVLNGVIDVEQRSAHFLQPHFIKSDKIWEVAAWVN